MIINNEGSPADMLLLSSADRAFFFHIYIFKNCFIFLNIFYNIPEKIFNRKKCLLTLAPGLWPIILVFSVYYYFQSICFLKKGGGNLF